MRKIVYLFLALLVAIPLGNAQKREEMNTAAMSRAMESISAGDPSEALKQLNVEIGNHPKNGYAYALMGYIYYSQEENGDALQSLEKAIKYLPSRDKEYLSFAYKCRADLYFKNLEEYDKALDDYNKAISYDPKNIQNYIDRASVVKSQKAPLLLGQSVLSRLGKIEIDNAAKVLKTTYTEIK